MSVDRLRRTIHSRRSRGMGWALVLVAALLSMAIDAKADSAAAPVGLPGKVAIAQKLGTPLPLDLMFRNEQGGVVRLRDLLRGKPILLNFVYYRCPMLCNMAL